MIEELKPLIRIALYALSGWLVRGGWLPADVAAMINTDPAVVELIIGGIVGIGTLGVYLRSNARAALDQAFGR